MTFANSIPGRRGGFTDTQERENNAGIVRETRLAQNQELFRTANARLEEHVEKHVGNSQRVPFLCECADAFCLGRVELTLEEYGGVRARDNRFAIVPGHPRVEGEQIVEHHDGFHVVEKAL
jgi:hypothetical protein